MHKRGFVILMIELVAFLGNQGFQYAANRHNAAWLLANDLPFRANLSWREKFHGEYASLDGSVIQKYLPDDNSVPQEKMKLADKIHFIKPHTFMNLSGESVQPAAAFFKIPPENILVVHDELELALGFASFKFSGGLGGHNGLRSLKACFGTADFWRLRIGIGRPDHPDISSWVLSDFAPHEQPVLEQVLQASAKGLIEALVCGPKTLLPEWNKRKIAELM
jgi:PTH1 family peptidyl-tRNA hydrolase